MLAGHARAIVTEVPGTTRDMISEQVEISGLPVLLVDTAGMREAVDAVEREGVERARAAADTATLLLLVLDQSEPLRNDDRRVLSETSSSNRILIRNKTDLRPAWTDDALGAPAIATSAATGSGFGDLRSTIAVRLTGCDDLRDAPALSNARHIALLDRARKHLAAAVAAAGEGINTPEEFLLADLQQARSVIEEITGKRTTDDLLHHIFERFCIGK